MGSFVADILDWSEVWGTLIPLAVWMRHKEQPGYLRPVVLYIWFALVINLIVDVIWKLKLVIPRPWNTNNYLYNVHSVIRFYLFSAFFIRLQQPFLKRLKKVMPWVFGLFVVLNFSLSENFFNYFNLSSRLLALEAGILLFYCLQYYFYKVKGDQEIGINQPDFWVVTGLGIYVAINFFIFLLYNELSSYDIPFAVDIWTIHNLSYVLLQIFLAKALYESRRR
jgi:hypothetical protein